VAEQKDELMQKVQALKTDLQDWRGKLDVQVKAYKTVWLVGVAGPARGTRRRLAPRAGADACGCECQRWC
jgi:hypothetical protein